MQLSFVLLKDKNKYNQSLLYLRISSRFTRVLKSTNIKILHSEWDVKKQRVRSSNGAHTYINAHLADIYAQAYGKLCTLKNPTREQIENAIKDNNAREVIFKQFVHDNIQANKNTLWVY